MIRDGMINRTTELDSRASINPNEGCSTFVSDSTDTSLVENRDPNCAVPRPQKDRIAMAAAVLKRHYRQAFDATDEAFSRKKIQRQGVSVKACSSDCCSEARDPSWCMFGSMQVADLDWSSVFSSAIMPRAAPLAGQSCFQLPCGITVHMVEQEQQLEAALQTLKESMQDGAVAIDLEWRPDYGRGYSKVALMQLATSYHCVLIRMCRLRKKSLPGLAQFLRDPSLVFVGYSWDGADEDKLQRTMGLGRRDFAKFIDVREVSQTLGYHGYGLATLAERIFGTPFPKSRKVTMSNWEAPQLSWSQVTYAALDALVCGHLLRSLRRWHSSPCVCPGCQQRVGAHLGGSGFDCTCGRSFKSPQDLRSHMASSGHPSSVFPCAACGRVVRLAHAGVRGAGVGGAAGSGEEGREEIGPRLEDGGWGDRGAEEGAAGSEGAGEGQRVLAGGPQGSVEGGKLGDPAVGPATPDPCGRRAGRGGCEAGRSERKPCRKKEGAKKPGRGGKSVRERSALVVAA
eukprot:jgi/Botrbrau1/15638/Bobra.4_1s0023.1